ncbi:hypothetical protein SUDANB95_01996 [Actinosynnema sp. ALI-1.44]
MKRLGVAVAALVLVGSAPAWAAETVLVHDADVTAAQQRATVDHWTPQRIAALHNSADQPPRDGSPFGKPRASEWPDPAQPVARLSGRLFATDPADADGEGHSCSGTVVRSVRNLSVVATAAHCVSMPAGVESAPRFFTRILFVPGYRNPATGPVRKFTVRRVVLSSAFLRSGEGTVTPATSKYDQAFLVVNREAATGRHLERVTGRGVPIGYDRPTPDVPIYSFGYTIWATRNEAGLPAFRGDRLGYCWHPTFSPLPLPLPDGTTDHRVQGMHCDLANGASGGARLTDFREPAGRGLLIGVNSIQNDDPFVGTYGTHIEYASVFTTAFTRPLADRAMSFVVT